MKNQKGITLIALIITIIIMLILVGVSVSVALNSGLFKTTQGAAKNTQIAAEAEQKLADGKVKIGDNWYASYQDYLDGIVLETGIILDEKAVLEVEEGYNAETTPKVTKEITISLNGIEGEITLENSDNTVATIDKEKAQSGDKITITALKVGTTTITATCGDETATCEVTVKATVPLAIGAFIQYDVEYTDAYKGYEYTKDNGWRLLDYTENEDGTYSNVKLISTGVPAMLYYYFNDTTNSSWYVTKESNGEGETDTKTLENFRNILTDGVENSYNFYTGSETYYGLQASAGLYYNFGEIKFAYGTSNRGKSLGYFTKIKSNGTTYGKTIDETTNNEVINTTEKTGAELFIPTGINATVRLMTLPEMNKILGKTDIDSKGSISDPTGAAGLFELGNIRSVISGYAYTSGYYWLASPSPDTSAYGSVCNVNYMGGVSNYYNTSGGVRPLISLSSNVQIVESETPGVFKIK